MKGTTTLTIVLAIALIITLGYIVYGHYQTQKSIEEQKIYASGYQNGYQKAILDSVSTMINDIQTKKYTVITYQNQTVPLCVCQTE